MIVGFPHPPGSGGPGSFQTRLESGLIARGHEISYCRSRGEYPDVILVVGGTRRLILLGKCKLAGVPIVYRLDGILWKHRRRWPGLVEFLTCEVRNLLFKITHACLADYVIYQSAFVKNWWLQKGWRVRRSWKVVHNGVDIDTFSPESSRKTIATMEGQFLICVEGHLDYSPYAIDLLNSLELSLHQMGIGIRVYGDFSDRSSATRLSDEIDYRGPVPRESIQDVYKDGVYLSLDVHAACPNTVIEALSSGVPVVGLDTGALSELVPADCGRIVAFGGDPWALENPNVEPLVAAICEIFSSYDRFANSARAYAKENYDIDDVVAKYINVFEKVSVKSNEVN